MGENVIMNVLFGLLWHIRSHRAVNYLQLVYVGKGVLAIEATEGVHGDGVEVRPGYGIDHMQ